MRANFSSPAFPNVCAFRTSIRSVPDRSQTCDAQVYIFGPRRRTDAAGLQFPCDTKTTWKTP